MKIRVLGCSGAISKDCRTTSFLIDDDVLIDAGTGVGDLTLDEDSHEVTRAGEPVVLTSTEFELLRRVARRHDGNRPH